MWLITYRQVEGKYLEGLGRLGLGRNRRCRADNQRGESKIARQKPDWSLRDAPWLAQCDEALQMVACVLDWYRFGLVCVSRTLCI